MVHGISFINHAAIWERRKDLTEAKKATIIKEIAKGKTTKSIAERINRHVVTVTRFLKNPSKRKPPSDRGVRRGRKPPSDRGIA